MLPTNDYLNMAIYSGTMGVQLSFAVSGFFNFYIVYPLMVKAKGKIPFILFALKRYLRIFPVLSSTILLIIISQVVVTSPTMKEASDLFSTACYTNWWKTLLMINNVWVGEGSVENVSLENNVSIKNGHDAHRLFFLVLSCRWITFYVDQFA